MLYSESDIQNALAAIVQCKGTKEAYVAMEQGGWAELVPGVIYKMEEKMEITTAREIITRAKKDEVYGGPMPEDDATALSAAEEIVKMAEEAWAQQVRGPEVEAILKIAAGAENGDAPTEATAESAPNDEDERQANIDTSDLPDNLTKVEPWEGYGDDTVKDIVGGINYYIEQGQPDLIELLNHIQAFEASHKARVRILNHISTARERLRVDEDSQNQEGQDSTVSGPTESDGPTEEGTAEEATFEESETPSVQSDSEAEELSRSPEAASESSDAAEHTESAASESSDEDRAGKDEAESSTQDQPKGSGKDSVDDSSVYQKLIRGIDDQLRRERLDIPKPPQEKAPELPWVMSGVSDTDLQNLMMQYAAVAFYKAYVLSRDERIAIHCKQAADEMHNTILVKTNKYDENNKEKKVAAIEAEVASHPDVRKWRRLQHKHEQLAAAAKRELDSYHRVYESLSRLETMRDNAWQRGRK